LSGGEQQMLAIGRGLMAKPRVLLLDEPTEGLAPIYVRVLYDLVRNLRNQSLTILIVEQSVHHVLQVADKAYVIENGRIVMQGNGKDLLGDERLKVAYLGL
jgi:branched-chain amino acid transport system ATP-binding protein